MSYVELHCHSTFSLLDGAGSPEALVARAAAVGMPALALTDHDAVYGVTRFVRAAREQGIRPILGAELTLEGDGAGAGGDGDTVHHLTLLVADAAGWHNLCYLISRAQHNRPKGEAALPPGELVGCTGGLIALSGCRRGAVAAALLRDRRDQALAAARRYRDLFGPENFWIELQNHFVPGDKTLVPRLAGLAASLGLGTVATNNVHYPTQAGHRLQDVLVCIRHNTTLDAAAGLCRLNSEYTLKPAGEMAALFRDTPQAVTNTLALAERCHFELDYGLQDLPPLPTPHGMSSGAYLRRLCAEALPARYPEAPGRARAQLAHELAVIERAGLANYFLIVADIVRFAREAGIRCQGRGSAANSLVAYLLHISPIDPLAHDLVFERFLSDERRAVPDIDVDFDAARREEVIQYLYETYGPAHTAMACTFVTFRARSALRDVGKALGLAPDVIAAAREMLETDREPESTDPHSPLRLLLELAGQLDGVPRHLGLHSGGMVLTGAPLMGRVPTEPAAMQDRVVVQWDKEALADAGLVKIDLLGLRMLSAIDEACALIAQVQGEAPSPDDTPSPPDDSLPAVRPVVARNPPPATRHLPPTTFDDPAVYAMIAAGDTIGVFQVESRAQVQTLPRLQPACFADLVVAISLIRPGPIQGNMVHPYLRRRRGEEPVTYAHPLLEPALEETLGVILFQEQVIKVARDLASFTPGQGERLRRALGAKRATAEIAAFRADFLAGARANGVSEAVAETVFAQLLAFGGYSFAKSHAAAFAVLVYQSAWLKRYHPAPFYTALLNHQPMGFWSPAVLANAARRQGVAVRPVDVHRSGARCMVEEGGIRLGFTVVKGMGEGPIERVIRARETAPFTSLADFRRRAAPGRGVTERLILAGALDELGPSRRRLLWALGAAPPAGGELALAYAPEAVALPPLAEVEGIALEQQVTGLSTGAHVMSFYREGLVEQGVLSTGEVAEGRRGQRVRVAGLVVVHQAPPTAKGHHFLTLEDETGLVDAVLRPRVYRRYRSVLRASRLVLVEGVLQRQEGVVGILVSRVVALERL